MRILGLISWYEESPSWLAATVASLAKVGVDRIVAIDGAYLLYPDGRARSGSEQHEAIRETATALGLGCTVHAPLQLWAGNEVEKRTFMFRLAELVAEPSVDWYFVMDADQVVSDCPLDLRAVLADTDRDVGETTFWERHDPQASPAAAEAARQFSWQESSFTVRNLFRAIPGLEVRTNHYTYETPDGRRLWGNGSNGHELEQPVDLRDLRIEHRTRLRPKARHEAQYGYYRRRDRLGVELGPCAFCDAPATTSAQCDWERLESDGEWQLAAGWVEVCTEHKRQADEKSERTIRELTNGERGLADLRLSSTPPTLLFEHEVADYAVGSQVIEAGKLRKVRQSTALASRRRGRRDPERDAACHAWLSELLATGEDCSRPSTEVKALGQQEGYAQATLNRAKVTLQVEHFRVGGYGADGHWIWRLPDEHPLRNPEPDEEAAVDG